MGTIPTTVPVEDYLAASYQDGDREYLDGEVLERNVGESRHAHVQGMLFVWLVTHYRQYWSLIEVRVRVSPSRYRIPDVCLGLAQRPLSGPVNDPPFLAVEILSPDDRAGDMQIRIDDYLGAGVKYVWVVNPVTQRGYVHTMEGSREAKDVLRTDDPNIEVPLAELFK